MRRSPQEAQVLKVIVAVRKDTSGAASAEVTDLEAALEVAQTKSIQYELEPYSTQAFPSMNLLEGKGPHDVITMTYSNGTSHFCRPFQWRGTGTSIVA